MTALTRQVRRTVPGIERRGLVVTLYPNQTIGLRGHRMRKEHVLPLAVVYRMAVKATVIADLQRRAEASDQARRAAGRPPQRHLVNRGLLR